MEYVKNTMASALANQVLQGKNVTNVYQDSITLRQMDVLVSYVIQFVVFIFLCFMLMKRI